MTDDKPIRAVHKRNKRPRNPKFAIDSLSGLSWTRVVGGQFPHNRDTPCCGGKARQDEMVIAIPHINKEGECLGTTVLHSSCLGVLLEQVPEDISIVRQRTQRIREFFLNGADT